MNKQQSAVETQHLDAQVGVLGSMLIDNATVGVVMAQAREEDFSGVYRSIFGAVRALFLRNSPVDPIAVNHELGDAYDKTLMDIMVNTPTAANVKLYLSILKEQALLSKVNQLGMEMGGARSIEDARKLMDDAGRLLMDRPSRRSYTAYQLMELFYKRMDEKPDYLYWGLPKLDERLYAEAGDFIVIGGHPSTGKTMLALQFAMAMSKDKHKRVGFFSFETNEGKFSDRFVAHELKLPMPKIKRRQYVSEDYTLIGNNADAYRSVPFDFEHANGMTVAEVQSIALAKRLDVVIVDYLQIINPGIASPFAVEQVRAISIALHNLAQSCGITVIALSQLRKAATDMPAKHAPTAADLKESGQIEQDADIIMMLSLEDPKRRDGPRKLQVVKNKEGECGKFVLDFDGVTQTFSEEGTFRELDKDEELPMQFSIDS